MLTLSLLLILAFLLFFFFPLLICLDWFVLMVFLIFGLLSLPLKNFGTTLTSFTYHLLINLSWISFLNWTIIKIYWKKLKIAILTVLIACNHVSIIISTGFFQARRRMDRIRVFIFIISFLANTLIWWRTAITQP